MMSYSDHPGLGADLNGLSLLASTTSSTERFPLGNCSRSACLDRRLVLLWCWLNHSITWIGSQTVWKSQRFMPGSWIDPITRVAHLVGTWFWGQAMCHWAALWLLIKLTVWPLIASATSRVKGNWTWHCWSRQLSTMANGFIGLHADVWTLHVQCLISLSSQRHSSHRVCLSVALLSCAIGCLPSRSAQFRAHSFG